MTFPQAPLQPPWEVTGETGVVLPSSTHSQSVNTAAAGVAEAGRKTGLSTAQSSSCTTSSQPPDLLKGDTLATSSLCQSPPSQEINAQSHWGNRYRSTNTCVNSSSSKQLHRGWPWELLPAFPAQYILKALAMPNLSELRNSCPGHPVPYSFGLMPST